MPIIHVQNPEPNPGILCLLTQELFSMKNKICHFARVSRFAPGYPTLEIQSA